MKSASQLLPLPLIVPRSDETVKADRGFSVNKLPLMHRRPLAPCPLPLQWSLGPASSSSQGVTVPTPALFRESRDTKITPNNNNNSPQRDPTPRAALEVQRSDRRQIKLKSWRRPAGEERRY
ncbi:hypothetical protein AAHC03_020757 [Spirometra sp. Aus1]